MAIYYPETSSHATTALAPDFELTEENVQETFRQLTEGALDPHEAGFLQAGPSLRQGIEAVTYTQPRVYAWEKSTDDAREADIVKLKSMYDLTEHGVALIGLLRAVDDTLTTKDIGSWRISRPLVRKLSLDEMPQLVVNVGGRLRGSFPNAMDMELVGAARPALKAELEHKGDNANPLFGAALRKMSKDLNVTEDDMFAMLGSKFVPGLITPATARGNRQLSSVEDFEGWMKGILDYAKIQQLPAFRRNLALGRLCISTAKHVAMRTNAS